LPFNCMPAKDFANRRSEIAYLRRLANSRETQFLGNILVEGPRGIGKTELLKQLYRSVYWENGEAVPFYYSFKTASLKAGHFARDYFTRFIRQYLSFLKKDPTLVSSVGLPLTKMIPPDCGWMFDLMDDFQTILRDGDFYDQILAAISAPVYAAEKTGNTIFILLDNFHLAARLYADTPGDNHSLAGFFETSLKINLCPHIFTGAPVQDMESIFSDGAFRGGAERFLLGPLADEAAYSIFRSLCGKLEISEVREESMPFMRFLGCNPLYVKNIAWALWKRQKREASEKNLWEIYSHEVTEGDSAFYWTSVLEEAIKDPTVRRAAVEVFMHLSRTGGETNDRSRLSRALGKSDTAVTAALSALRAAGLLQTGSVSPAKDAVLTDFMHGLFMKDIEDKPSSRIREELAAKRFSDGSAPTCFEMVLPSAADAELVAAKAMDQIGMNLKLTSETIGRLQLALIEACINAMEHSGSHDGRVFIKFCTAKDSIEISVESSGRFFDPDAIASATLEEKLGADSKRGWGLKLIQSVMDDVKIERIGDRTRVRLKKKFRHEEVLHGSV